MRDLARLVAQFGLKYKPTHLEEMVDFFTTQPGTSRITLQDFAVLFEEGKLLTVME